MQSTSTVVVDVEHTSFALDAIAVAVVAAAAAVAAANSNTSRPTPTQPSSKNKKVSQNTFVAPHYSVRQAWLGLAGLGWAGGW